MVSLLAFFYVRHSSASKWKRIDAWRGPRGASHMSPTFTHVSLSPSILQDKITEDQQAGKTLGELL